LILIVEMLVAMIDVESPEGVRRRMNILGVDYG